MAWDSTDGIFVIRWSLIRISKRLSWIWGKDCSLSAHPEVLDPELLCPSAGHSRKVMEFWDSSRAVLCFSLKLKASFGISRCFSPQNVGPTETLRIFSVTGSRGWLGLGWSAEEHSEDPEGYSAYFISSFMSLSYRWCDLCGVLLCRNFLVWRVRS